LRKYALPFDWNITPTQSVIKLLDNNFENFLNKENLYWCPPTRRLLFTENNHELIVSDQEITPVICTKYNMLFPHDFINASEQTYYEVWQKYYRRIERLRALLESSQYVIFVAVDEELNEWQAKQYAFALRTPPSNHFHGWEKEITTIIQKNFPKLKFTVCTFKTFSEHIEQSVYLKLRKFFIRQKEKYSILL
jgi:hypothetical protein